MSSPSRRWPPGPLASLTGLTELLERWRQAGRATGRPARRGAPAPARATLLAALLTALPSTGSAVFIPVSDDRQLVEAFNLPSALVPPVPFAAWSESLTIGETMAKTATLDSEAVTPTRIAASGTSGGCCDSGTAFSIFSITFDVDVATPYALSGLLTHSDFLGSTALVSLSSGATTLFEEELSAAVNEGLTSLAFADSGVLAPGQYTLAAHAAWFDNADYFDQPPASFDFVFVVPEPSTLALLGLGLGWLVRTRSRS